MVIMSLCDYERERECVCVCVCVHASVCRTWLSSVRSVCTTLSLSSEGWGRVVRVHSGGGQLLGQSLHHGERGEEPLFQIAPRPSRHRLRGHTGRERETIIYSVQYTHNHKHTVYNTQSY